MNIGILLPGFSSDEDDWAIPVQQNLVREMARHDEVRVIALRYPHRRDCYSVYGATVYSIGVGAWVRGWGRLALWWEAIHLIRRLHKEKPFDVLHSMWADETGLIAAWAGRLLNIPVIVSIAGGELVGFNELDYGLQRSAFSRWTVGQALYGADRVIAACSYAKGLIAQAGYHISEEAVRIIPLGVDADVFVPSKVPIAPNHLIHAASLVSVKDQATLLRAIAHLDNVTLDIVGEGPEREKLMALAVELGISKKVNFVGNIPHLAMPSFYQRAALHVLTSRHEGLGMVTLEAAACGIPTVSTAVGIVPDSPELGVSVPVGDDAALATEIRYLLGQPERRAALAKSAYTLAHEKFSIQQTAQNFREVYEKLQA